SLVPPGKMNPASLLSILHPAAAAAKNGAACGRADEVDEVRDLRAGQRRVLLDVDERLGGVQLRLQQVAIGLLELADDLFGESPADESHLVEAVKPRAVPDRLCKRQRI